MIGENSCPFSSHWEPENQDALNSSNLKEFEMCFEIRNAFPLPVSISITLNGRRYPKNVFYLTEKLTANRSNTEFQNSECVLFLPSPVASVPVKRKEVGPSCSEESPNHTDLAGVCRWERRRNIQEETWFSFLLGVNPRMFLSLCVTAHSLGEHSDSPMNLVLPQPLCCPNHMVIQS